MPFAYFVIPSQNVVTFNVIDDGLRHLDPNTIKAVIARVSDLQFDECVRFVGVDVALKFSTPKDKKIIAGFGRKDCFGAALIHDCIYDTIAIITNLSGEMLSERKIAC